jgi:ArsR family transcriptional regulator
MTAKEAAAGFAALGSAPRLEVLRALVRAGHEGLAISQIQDAVGIPASTLAHHLRFLASAGLIEQARDGRSILSRARFEQVAALSEYLLAECCVDESLIAPRKYEPLIAPKADEPPVELKTAAPRIIPKISIKRHPAGKETA